MAKSKFLSLIAMLGLVVMFLTSCEEDDVVSDGDPAISSVSHIIAPIGTEIIIRGTGFGSKDSEGGVLFNGQLAPAADYVNWTSTEIKVKVPANATSGKLVVDNSGKKSVGVDFYVGALTPAAPTNLRASSLNDTSVVLRWDASVDATKSIFKGYVVSIGEQTFNVEKSANQLTIGGLTAGEIYQFSFVSSYTNDAKSETPTMIQWSPATRFTERSSDGESIRIFESASSLGSGLNIFSDDSEEPMALTIANSAVWSLGLYTRENSLVFGSAGRLGYTYGNAPTSCEFDVDAIFVNSLDEVFDTEALDKRNFAERIFDMNGSNFAGKSFVIIGRAMLGSNSEYNYFKVLVKNTGGQFLQGTAPNRYIEMEVSYQKTAGVPYAIHQ